MDCQILQDDLGRPFNVDKCHSMRVTRHPPDKHIQFDYTLHQQRLEQVQSAKYLGLKGTATLMISMVYMNDDEPWILIPG